MHRVINLKDYPGDMEQAIKYYHSKWGGPNNYPFFYDAIIHSSSDKEGLPRFFLLMKEEKIVGCCGLIMNDFISRHDLYPWLCGIFVEERERGQALGNLLMEYADFEAVKAGYKIIYLTTEHNGYYEKYEWKRIEEGYDPSGEQTRIYMKSF